MKITFIGSNGAGKTTLLAALANLGSGGRKENNGVVTFSPENEDDVESVRFRNDALNAAQMHAALPPSTRNVSLHYILEVKDGCASPKTPIELTFFDYVGEDFRSRVAEGAIKPNSREISQEIDSADAAILTFSAENFEQEKDAGVFASITDVLNKIDTKKKILSVVITKADKFHDEKFAYGISQSIKERFAEKFPVLAELSASFFAVETFAISCLQETDGGGYDWSNPQGLDDLFCWIVAKRKELNDRMAKANGKKVLLVVAGVALLSVGGFFGYSWYEADLRVRQDEARKALNEEIEMVFKADKCQGALSYSNAIEKLNDLKSEHRFLCLCDKEKRQIFKRAEGHARDGVIRYYVEQLLKSATLEDFDERYKEFKSIGLPLVGGYEGKGTVEGKRQSLVAEIRSSEIRKIVAIQANTKGRVLEKIRRIKLQVNKLIPSDNDRDAFMNMAGNAEEFFGTTNPYVRIGKLAVGYESAITTGVFIESDESGCMFRSKDVAGSSPDWKETNNLERALSFEEQIWISVVRTGHLINKRPWRLLRTEVRSGPIALLECIKEANESLLQVDEYVNPDDRPFLELRFRRLFLDEYSLEIGYGNWTLEQLKTFIRDYNRFIANNTFWESLRK